MNYYYYQEFRNNRNPPFSESKIACGSVLKKYFLNGVRFIFNTGRYYVALYLTIEGVVSNAFVDTSLFIDCICDTSFFFLLAQQIIININQYSFFSNFLCAYLNTWCDITESIYLYRNIPLRLKTSSCILGICKKLISNPVIH